MCLCCRVWIVSLLLDYFSIRWTIWELLFLMSIITSRAKAVNYLEMPRLHAVQGDGMQQSKRAVELDLRYFSYFYFHIAGTLPLPLMGSDVNHSIQMQVVQCGISGPDQELARRSLLDKFLCLLNTNRRLWEQHSAFIPHDSWQTQDSSVDYWVSLGDRSKIKGSAKSSVLSGQGPRFLYSSFIY